MIADVSIKMAIVLFGLVLSVDPATAKVTCFKVRPAAFAGVLGHADSEAKLYLGLSNGVADFDQMLLTGGKIRVSTTLNCSSGATRYCNLQADGGQLVIFTFRDVATIRMRQKALTVRIADESGESYLGVRDDKTTAKRTYQFDRVPDDECTVLMQPIGPQVDEPSRDQDPADAPPAQR